jgi:cytochrome bd ubiquinol oxidase subunit II
MTTALNLAAIMVVALVFYVLLAGADFGAGLWDLLSSGRSKEAQRDLVAKAIQPIWEANHVWLILIFVLMFSGFPSAFGFIMVALYIPILLMLLGIVLRGSSFVFQAYSATNAGMQRTYARVFSVSSCFTPFFAGLIIGSLSEDHASVVGGAALDARDFIWLTPFSISVGLLTLAIFAYLAATYLTVEAESEELRLTFRNRAIAAGVATAFLAIAIFFLAGSYSHGLWDGLLHNHLALGSGLGAAVTMLMGLVALFYKHYRSARVMVAAFACALVVGWASAQYPYLVRPDRTIFNSLGSENTAHDIVVASIVGAFVLFPSLTLLLYIFKDQKRKISIASSVEVRR